MGLPFGSKEMFVGAPPLVDLASRIARNVVVELLADVLRVLRREVD
jgi:hypothetical protein